MSFAKKIMNPELSLKKEIGMNPDGGITTEFSMWLHESVSISEIKNSITRLSFEVNTGQDEKIFELYFLMQEYWDRLRAVARKDKDAMDIRFKDLQNRMTSLKSYRDSNMKFIIPISVTAELQNMKRTLFQMQQDMGLGIPWIEKMDDRDRIKNALR